MQEEYRNSITDMENMTIMSGTGSLIKLKEIAEIKEYWCPPSIERERRERCVTITITPYKVALSKLAASATEILNDMTIPQGITWELSGNYKDQKETFSNMITLALLILMLVYVVMASQFESFSKPFILMMSFPFALSGVVWALLITNKSLDMIGALGIILLIGIVIKNGIVLVDYINLMRDRGHALTDAVALACQSRIRPVLMTAITTILGMVPMALSKSEGSEMWVPLGIVVIGGMLVATLITLYLVPILYSIMARKGERDKNAKKRKNFYFMGLDDDIEQVNMSTFNAPTEKLTENKH